MLLLTGLTRDGVYLIEDGEVTGAVNNFRFNESPLDLLRRATRGRRQRGHPAARVGGLGHPGGDAVAADPGLPHVVGEPGAIIGGMDDEVYALSDPAHRLGAGR